MLVHLEFDSDLFGNHFVGFHMTLLMGLCVIQPAMQAYSTCTSIHTSTVGVILSPVRQSKIICPNLTLDRPKVKQVHDIAAYQAKSR